MTDAATVIIDLLGRGHAVQFQARGDSMYPLIRDDDYLHVEPLLHVEPVDEFRTGDIVLVLAERGLTAHRVVSHREGIVVTRGDNAPLADDPVPRDRVLGKVTSVIRDGRAVNIWGAAARAAAFARRWLRRRTLSLSSPG